MKHLFFTIIIAFAITNYSYSQVTQEWVSRYNGPVNGDDYGKSIAIDGSGNVYVTGSSSQNGINNNLDYATAIYNSAGALQWVQRYNGPGNGDDNGNSIAVDGSGNVYVTGSSLGNGTNFDYATIKYNSNGDSLWVRRYNGPGNGEDDAYALAIDGSGNVYVTGVSKSAGTADDYDYATIKYNSAGDSLWVVRYNGPGSGFGAAYSLKVDSFGNVFVTGFSFGSGTSYDYATIKYNSSGVEQWVQRYNGPGNLDDRAVSLVMDASGNVYVTGSSLDNGTNFDYATIKYNSNGDSLWVRRYNGPGNIDDYPAAITLDASGNVLVTGSIDNVFIPGRSKYGTIKYDSSGNSLWVAMYSGFGSNRVNDAFSIAVDGFGNAYVTGTSEGNGGFNDYATIKYDLSGVQQWVQRYNGPGNNNDFAYSIAVDSLRNVYVTGYSGGIGTNNDFATIKYSQSTGIQNITSEIPKKYSLSQNYPNPFNPVTKINYSIPNTQYTILKVYDVLGNEVATLVNEKQNAGSYSVEWDASNFSSGIYFYKIETNGFAETKRMTLIK